MAIWIPEAQSPLGHILLAASLNLLMPRILFRALLLPGAAE
jgi:hypothetical protein